jgi:tetratricopeptide (TPR) repeat protein
VGIWKRIGQFKRAAGDWYEALRLEVLGTQSQRSGLDRTQFVQPKQKQMRSPKAPKIQASQPDPGLAARYCHDAELMASQGEWEQAIAHYALAVECDPENGQLHYGLGQVFAVKAHWEQAVTCFERAISLNPEILPAYLDLRNALVQSCRWEEMMNNATLHIGLGRAMAAQQRWREAVGFFRRAAQIDPDRVEVYIGLREALLQLERWEDAQYPAQKIVELQPGYLVGRNSEPELNRL